MAFTIRPRADNAVKIFDSQTVTKNTAVTSEEVDVSDVAGNYALQYSIDTSASATGARATFELLCSLDGINYPKAYVIASAYTISSAVSGKNIGIVNDIYGIKRMKVRVTETTNTNDLVVTCWLAGA